MSDAVLRAETFDAFRAVLRPFAGNESVSESTRILQDLGIDGDDADEFLEAVHAKFGTRFDGFVFSTYFSNGEIGSGEGWLRRRGFEDPRKPLSVGHLLDVIIGGAWFDPPDQPAVFIKGSRLQRYAVRAFAAMRFPVFYSLSALALGEWIGETLGLARGIGLVLFGLPVAALLTSMMWRKLPAN
jgi:hypothetical protein